jgi:hypothetical protein
MELGLGVICHLESVNFMSFWILNVLVGKLLSSEANTNHILPTSGYQTGENEREKNCTDISVCVCLPHYTNTVRKFSVKQQLRLFLLRLYCFLLVYF